MTIKTIAMITLLLLVCVSCLTRQGNYAFIHISLRLNCRCRCRYTITRHTVRRHLNYKNVYYVKYTQNKAIVHVLGAHCSTHVLS